MSECDCGCGRLVARRYAKGHSRRVPIRERILNRVSVVDDCWEWQGAIATTGYGVIGAGHGNAVVGVHRAAYEVFVGEIPDGAHIDHLCRNRRCCNPAHLEPVTQAENNRRAAAHKRALVTGDMPKGGLSDA